jgi:hypothetical protein
MLADIGDAREEDIVGGSRYILWRRCKIVYISCLLTSTYVLPLPLRVLGGCRDYILCMVRALDLDDCTGRTPRVAEASLWVLRKCW